MPVTFTEFKRAGDFSAGTTATDITVTTAQWNTVGSLTVGAQQVIYYGAGVVANGVDTRETAKVSFDSVTGAITGAYRLAIQDANGISTIPVVSNDNVNFLAGIKLGIKSPGAKEDSKMLILFKPDATTIIDYSDANNTVNIPVTIVNLN